MAQIVKYEDPEYPTWCWNATTSDLQLLQVGSEKRREDFERRLQINEQHLEASICGMSIGDPLVWTTGWFFQFWRIHQRSQIFDEHGCLLPTAKEITEQLGKQDASLGQHGREAHGPAFVAFLENVEWIYIVLRQQ